MINKEQKSQISTYHVKYDTSYVDNDHVSYVHVKCRFFGIFTFITFEEDVVESVLKQL